jgi:hypothetical protein
MAKKKERVIIYIDGFNLYYSLRYSGEKVWLREGGIPEF